MYICMYCEFSFLLLSLLLLLWHVINNLVLPNNTKCALPLVEQGEEWRGRGAERVRRGVRAKARYEAKTALCMWMWK